MPKVSIIVPVYKAEQYINRCIDSILAQTFTDLELLLVDDGSPDRSGEMCDEYAKKDKRIRVFHKENGGVSSARQRGQNEAVGEYTIHVDPDDWVEPTMLEELYAKAKAEDADMVICDYYVNNGNHQQYVKQQPLNLDSSTVLHELFQQLHGSCWNKLVKRVCYNVNNVIFPQNMVCWEDLYVNVSLIKKGNLSIAYLPKAFYHYDIFTNANSLVRKPTIKTIDSQKYFIDALSPILGMEFDEEMYRLKVQTKDLAWRFDLLNADKFKLLFPEIAGRYISDFKSSLHPTKRCVILSFKHFRLAKFIYKCLLFVNSIKEKYNGK